MKKRFFSLFAMTAGLFMASCSNDELISDNSGGKAQVTFALNLENQVNTKAISDGSGADKLVYAVYDENGTALNVFEGEAQKEETGLTDLKSGHTVSINLAKGKTYQIAFWAQNAACTAYNTSDLKSVQVDYAEAVNNDEARDAFFKTVKVTVTGDATENVELKRPFAQLNVGVTAEDWKAAVVSKGQVLSSKAVIQNVANVINLLTGEATGSEQVEYALNDIPTEKLSVKNGEGAAVEYHYLSMSYILTGAEKSVLESLAFTFKYADNTEFVFSQGLNNVPVQRNWRTNILGNILNGNVKFNITIDSAYDGENNIEGGTQTTNEIVPGVVLEGSTYRLLSVDGLMWFRDVVNGKASAPEGANAEYYKQNNFYGKTVVLANDIDLSNVKTWIPISSGCAVGGNGLRSTFSGTFDGGNHTISNMTVSVTGAGVENGAGLFANAVGTIKNVKLVNPTVAGNHYAGAVVGYTYGHIENCHVENGKIVSNVSQKDNGDKAGGIVGYVGEGDSKVENCSVINTTVQAYRDVAALIGCAQTGTTVSGNTIDNVTVIANQLVEYIEAKDANAGQIIGRKVGTITEQGNNVNNAVVEVLKSPAEGESVEVKTFTTLELATKAKVNVKLTSDVKGNASGNSGYGKAGLTTEGGTLDGNGKTLEVYGANLTWDCAIYTKGGTIKNLTIGGAFRGIFSGGCASDIIIENVVIDNVCYTFNSDGSNPNYSLIVKNTTLKGWTSYTSGYKSVSFADCKFGKGTGKHQYAYCRPYSPTTFTNCHFEEGFELDATQTTDITFVNCYVGNTLVTEGNIVNLLGADAAQVIVKNN